MESSLTTHISTVDGALRETARLRRTLRGELVLPADAGFERARRVWNGFVDKHPAAIAYCVDTDDVVGGDGGRLQSAQQPRDPTLAVVGDDDRRHGPGVDGAEPWTHGGWPPNRTRSGRGCAASP